MRISRSQVDIFSKIIFQALTENAIFVLAKVILLFKIPFAISTCVSVRPGRRPDQKSRLRTPNKTEKRSKRQQGRKKPNGYQPCVHIGRAGACIDGTRQKFAQQPSGAFQDERNCPPHVWQCGALYVSRCTPVCKTENRTLYQREVSEDDKWVSRANFAGRADDPAYIPAFCNHSHWRQ